MEERQRKSLDIYVTDSHCENNEEVDSNDTTPILHKVETPPKRNKLIGGILAFVSSFLFTVSSVIIQKMSLNFSDAMIVRYFVQVVFLLAIICMMKIREEGKSPLKMVESFKNLGTWSLVLLIFQGLSNGLCVLGEFMCVSFIPIGDATAIIFSSPLPSMVLSAMFLGHTLKLYKMSCGLMLYLGVILVVKPPFLFKEPLISFNRLVTDNLKRIKIIVNVC